MIVASKKYTIYQIADIKPKKHPLNVSRLELSIKSMVKISISHRYYFAILMDWIILEHTYQRHDNMKHNLNFVIKSVKRVDRKAHDFQKIKGLHL